MFGYAPERILNQDGRMSMLSFGETRKQHKNKSGRKESERSGFLYELF